MDNLILSREIEESIEKGNFNIYPINSIEEATEILMNKMFEDIKIMVKNKLDIYNQSKELKKD